MLRRNLDAIAIGLACIGMAIVSRIPPPGDATARVIRIENAVMHNRCALVDRFLSRHQ